MEGFVIALLGFMPTPISLPQPAWTVTMIFIGTIWMWMRKGIGVPSLICLGLLSFVPELGAKQVISSSFGNTTFAFLLFTFICCHALSSTGVIPRVTERLLNSKWVKGKTFNGYGRFWRLNIMFGVAIIIFGMWISPTVLFVAFLPLHESIMQQTNICKKDIRGAITMSTLVIGCGISSGMTLIGHIFPTLALGVLEKSTGVVISSWQYMMIGIPIGLLCFGLVLAGQRVLLHKVTSSNYRRKPLVLGKSAEATDIVYDRKVTLICISVLCWWILPDLLTSIGVNPGMLKCDNFIPPLVGSVLLCLVPHNEQPLIKLDKALSIEVPWTSLIMCASTLALSNALTAESIEFIPWLSETVTKLTVSLETFEVIGILLLWTMLMTNFTSNMVTSTTVSTIAVAIGLTLPGINIGAICALIGLSASYAFAAQSAMPCVAIASSSGWITPSRMFRFGLMAALSSFTIIFLVGYPLANTIL